MPVKHTKVTGLPDITQPELDAAIAAGQYPPGTTLADVVNGTDWNDDHEIDLGITDINGLDTALASLSTSTSTGLSSGVSSVVSLSTATSTGLSSGVSSVVSLSTTVSTGLSTATSGLASLSTSTSSSVSSLSTAIAGGGGGGSSPSVITATPSADQNDYAPTGWSTCTTLRMNHSAPIVISGFAAGTAGEKKTIINVTAELPLVICDEAVTSSTAANRVKVGGRHLVLWPGEAVVLEYDGTASRWLAQEIDGSKVIRNWVMRSITPVVGGTGQTASGVAVANEGSATSQEPAATNYKALTPRNTWSTGASSGASAGFRTSGFFGATGGTGGGGFILRCLFGGESNPADAGASFVGIRSAGAGAANAIGDVDASSLTGCFGVGTDATQGTFRRLNNDSSGAASASNLGANFPWDSTSCFALHLASMPGATGLSGVIWRQDDLSVVPLAWFETTDIPTMPLKAAFHFHVGNRAAAAAYILSHMATHIWTPD